MSQPTDIERAQALRIDTRAEGWPQAVINLLQVVTGMLVARRKTLYELIVKEYRLTVTGAQQRYYFGVVLPTIARHLDESYTTDQLHYEELGPMLYGEDRISVQTGLVRRVAKRTSIMTARQFWDEVVVPVRQYAEQTWQLHIPDPDRYWWFREAKPEEQDELKPIAA